MHLSPFLSSERWYDIFPSQQCDKMTNEASSWPLYIRGLGRRREEGCKKPPNQQQWKKFSFLPLIYQPEQRGLIVQQWVEGASQHHRKQYAISQGQDAQDQICLRLKRERARLWQCHSLQPGCLPEAECLLLQFLIKQPGNQACPLLAYLCITCFALKDLECLGGYLLKQMIKLQIQLFKSGSYNK